MRRTFDDAATFVFMSRLLEQLSNVGWKTNYRITVSISIVAYRSCQSLDRYYDVLKIKKKKNSPCITCSQGRIQVLSTAEAKAATNVIQYFFWVELFSSCVPSDGKYRLDRESGLAASHSFAITRQQYGLSEKKLPMSTGSGGRLPAPGSAITCSATWGLCGPQPAALCFPLREFFH